MAGTQNLIKLYRLSRLPEIYKDSVGISVYKFNNGQVHVVFSGFILKPRLHMHMTPAQLTTIVWLT